MKNKCTLKTKIYFDYIQFTVDNYVKVVKWLKNRGFVCVSIHLDDDRGDLVIYLDDDCTDYLEVYNTNYIIFSDDILGSDKIGIGVYEEEFFKENFAIDN